MKLLIVLVSIVSLGINLQFKAPQPFEATTVEQRAASVGLSVPEYELFSGIVESESNRSTDGDLEGRIMIALTIWNRVNDARFPSTVTDVIAQQGQFSTYRRSSGTSCVSGTVYSDEAIVRAYEWIQSGEEYPEVLFFNCRGFFGWREAYNPDRNGDGTPDGAIGGNYFSL